MCFLWGRNLCYLDTFTWSGQWQVDKKTAAARLVATSNLATFCMTLKINFDSATSLIFSGITPACCVFGSVYIYMINTAAVCILGKP